MDVNPSGKQQGTGARSQPPSPPLPARVASPPEWILISSSPKNSQPQPQPQPQPQSHSFQLPTRRLMVIIAPLRPTPASTSTSYSRHVHNLPVLVRAFPALPHPTPQSNLAALDYMFSRFAAQPPSIIDRLAGIRAAKAAIKGGQQQLYGPHPSPLPSRLTQVEVPREYGHRLVSDAYERQWRQQLGGGCHRGSRGGGGGGGGSVASNGGEKVAASGAAGTCQL